MMDRKKFARFLALTAASQAAIPEQIAAFEHYFNINAPSSGGPFVAVDEIYLGGIAHESTPIIFDVLKYDEVILPLSFNAFGGVVRWMAMPLQQIIVPPADFKWRVRHVCKTERLPVESAFVIKNFTGVISYIDQTGLRHYKQIIVARGSLRE